MKRSLLGLIALLALACASLVLTQPSPTAASRGNVASGSGSGHFKDISLSFGAADHGEFNYTGQATFIYETARQKVTIDVECVSVAGNTASIAGTVTKSTNPDFPAGEQPYPVVFNVVDNGEGAAAPPDLLTPPRYGKCGDFPMAYTDSDRGNIQVRFVAPDKDCTKCPEGTHCAGNGECVGGGGGGKCPKDYKECCDGSCVPIEGGVCEVCPIIEK